MVELLIGHTHIFNYIATKILKVRSEQLWQANLMNDDRKVNSQKNKLRTYRQFKCEYEMEDYLLYMTHLENRCKLLKFRTSCHKLRIETGRQYPHVPVEERLCTLCNMGSVEDEEHFLMTCGLYKNSRGEFLDKMYEIFPDLSSLSDHEQFIWIMASKNATVINTLAEFVSDNMNVQNTTLSN